MPHSYGADAASARVVARLREIFEAPEAAVYLVATGTAANALALACLCPPWATVYCHRNAHVAEDECGAPEFFSGGAKLTLIDGAHGRITPDGLRRALDETANVGRAQCAEGRAVADQRHRGGHGLRAGGGGGAGGDGAGRGSAGAYGRGALRQCLVSAGCTPAELTWKAGVDALSFGGTKNGCFGVEAVVLFDPARAWEFELRRKRGGHLFSKYRFLAAQMEGYLAGDLWLTLAARANARAAALARGLAAVPGARLLHDVEANAVFAAWPRAGHRALAGGGRGLLSLAAEPEPGRAGG